MNHAIAIRDIREEDAGEVMTLQRAAFVSEAQIYGSADMPPLTQTLDEIAWELRDNLGCVAFSGARMVGALRARMDGALLLVGRIAIAPDVQGGGIGSQLLDAVERRGAAAGAREAELFTGSRSEANLRLYERQGYRETERIDEGDGTAQVFLRKRIA